MSERMETLLISYEAVPFAKVGGLADVAGALPDALASVGMNCRLVIPRFGQIDPEKFGLEEVELPGDWSVGIDFVSHPFRVWRGHTPGGAEVWLLGDERFYGREGIYQDAKGDPFPDDLERLVFFAKGVLELAKCLEWRPRVIHANDYQTALSLAYIRETYAHEDAFRDVGLVYSIHNLAYQGIQPASRLSTLGISEDYMGPLGAFEFHGNVNLMKVGIHYADLVHTVSPTYAREILGSEQGAGLEGFLKVHESKLRGILNGIDEEIWSPITDSKIPVNFDVDDLEGKQKVKRALLERMGLDPARADWPLVGCIGRLVAQKGVELILGVLEDLLQSDALFIGLGSGARDYEKALQIFQERHPDRCAVEIGFDDELAHWITAGADIFLMPSRYEPCGLNQMYAQRYGTIPVVRRTGGLADTVIDWNPETMEGTGFLFESSSASALGEALGSAIQAWSDPAARAQLRRNGMTQEFGWPHRAAEYRRLYEDSLLSNGN